MNYMDILKKWALPALILVVAFTYLPSLLSTYLGSIIGSVFGQITGYVISFMVAIMAIWFMRLQQVKKYID